MGPDIYGLSRPKKPPVREVFVLCRVLTTALWTRYTFEKSRGGPAMTPNEVPGFVIRPFTAGDVAYVIEGQLMLYAREYGFTSDIWRDYLTGGVRALADNFDPDRDCILIPEKDGRLCGCIAIAHVDVATAQLRFFFVEDSLRGLGAGRQLMERAVGFCREKGYKRVFLWTFSGLAAARHLYAAYGFTLTETAENTDWGEPVTEERWDLVL